MHAHSFLSGTKPCEVIMSRKLLLFASLAIAAILSITAVKGQDLGRSQDVARLDMDAVLNLDKASIRVIQRRLLDRSISPGKIDGIKGPRTSGAIRSFQERFGMKSSGNVDNQLLFSLGLPELALDQSP